MKKMTLGNRILAMLLAFVMILTGIAPGTFNARVVKAADATEQRFNRIYREDGIVQVADSIYQNSDSILTPKETSHRIKARKAGEVTDNSQVSDKVDIDQIVKEGITSASTFLNSQNYKYAAVHPTGISCQNCVPDRRSAMQKKKHTVRVLFLLFQNGKQTRNRPIWQEWH